MTHRKSVTLYWPTVPDVEEDHDTIVAVGRLAMAWAATEFYFPLVMSALSARFDDFELFAADTESRLPTGVVELERIFEEFSEIVNLGTRRSTLKRFAEEKAAAGGIQRRWFDEIAALMERHNKLASRRNRYAHSAMAKDDQGKLVMLSMDMLKADPRKSEKMQTGASRRNNNLVRVAELDRLIDEVDAWIRDITNLVRHLELNVPKTR